ncbi:AI-2E family transporter [Helicobacter labetoulli]|uniref:AI-2E family transporter n=1 Tax=Helicobacter labetoulli TaxID=2315333 RepID=UPI000EF70445|nr:AI-2E family transporter [Helicobacter labetoulli]
MRAITFFWLVFIVSAYSMYHIYAAYLMDILIALLLYIVTYGLYASLLKRVKYPIVSASLSICILVLLLVVPLFFLFKTIITSAAELNPTDFSAFVEGSKEQILSLLVSFPEIEAKARDILSSISASSILGYVLNFSSQLGKSSLGFMVDTGFIIVFLFFYFLYGKQAYDYVIELIPFENIQISSVLDEVTNVIKVVFYTSLVNIVLQGAAFGILIMFFGYDGVFFGMLYGFASIVPIVGGGLVWLPLAGYEFYLGNTQNAIIIALYALIVCAVFIDNVIKPILIGLINKKVLKTSVRINELLIFFAILAGLTSIGFWGIILGPAITALFISLLRIYRKQTAKESLTPSHEEKIGL